MSEIVNDSADALAGEYVLGTLDGDERSHAQSLLAADEEFAAKVKVWERRLGELHLMVEPVEPDAAVWERIKANLPETQPDLQLAEPQSSPPVPEAPAADDASARLESALAAISQAASAPEPAPEPAPAPAVVPPPEPSADAASPIVPALVPSVMQPPVGGREDRLSRRRLGRWRALALLTTLLVVAMGALIAAWRFAPDRVPLMLRPVELMRLVGINVAPSPPTGAPRRVPPPGSQFDE